MSFKVGDQVFLKSGGPKMTVVGLNWNKQPGRIRCKWFSSKDDIFKFEVFTEEALTPDLGTPRPKVV